MSHMQDGYVPVRLAADGLKRSVRTIRTWVAAGTVRHVRDDKHGILVHGGDLVEAHTTRGQRQRASATEAA